MNIETRALLSIKGEELTLINSKNISSVERVGDRIRVVFNKPLSTPFYKIETSSPIVEEFKSIGLLEVSISSSVDEVSFNITSFNNS